MYGKSFLLGRRLAQYQVLEETFSEKLFPSLFVSFNLLKFPSLFKNASVNRSNDLGALMNRYAEDEEKTTHSLKLLNSNPEMEHSLVLSCQFI